LRFWNSDVVENIDGVLTIIADRIRSSFAAGTTPTRRWRAGLPLSGGGKLDR
jgi:hypothetical protein